jgi:hypothetical protein
MSYILIPHIVSSSTAMIWVGAVGEKVRAKSIYLRYTEINTGGVKGESKDFLINPSEWRTWKTRHVHDRLTSRSAEIQVIYYQRVTIGLREPLKARTKYEVELLIRNADDTLTEAEFQNYSQTIKKGQLVRGDSEKQPARASVATLPEALPKEGERPFTVLLGSCFYRENDKEGMVGKTYLQIPEKEKPEIKFLTGDQVYLDNPWMETTLNLGRAIGAPEKMRTSFFHHYLKNWTQVTTNEKGDLEGGFNLLLRDGANYFCSDDHEFWNNAPDFGGVAAALTIARGQRGWWFREAAELFRLFQSLAPWMTFDVPPLSFCIADTRINRLTRRKQFMEEDDLEAIGNWIQKLNGPGVLVLGQLLMEKKTPFFPALFDKALPDYPRQYKKLLKYIKESNHTIVALSGDVHFGRVAVCDLDKEKSTKFIEVISSPMYVVSNWRNKKRVGEYKPAPRIFGTKVEHYQVADLKNHFVTLEFSQDEGAKEKPEDPPKIKMKIKTWEILREGAKNKSKSVEIETLDLN